MRAWLRYWFPKTRPPKLPSGLRGPYNPSDATRDELLLMAALRAKTPQHSARVQQADGRPAVVIAQERRPKPRRWRYKLKILIWRIVGHWRPRNDRIGAPRLGVRYDYHEDP